MSKDTKSFVIIGLGVFGGTVATELSRFGNHILGIDIDEKSVARFAADLPETAILDASDEMALRELGVERYDVALVAIGENIEASILAAMNLRVIGLPVIWVKAVHRTHQRILAQLGVDRVIQPEHEMGQHIAQVLNNSVVQDYIDLDNGYGVVSIRIPPQRSGQTLNVLKLQEKFQIDILGMMRGTEFIPLNHAQVQVDAGDIILALGKRAELQHFGEYL